MKNKRSKLTYSRASQWLKLCLRGLGRNVGLLFNSPVSPKVL